MTKNTVRHSDFVFRRSYTRGRHPIVAAFRLLNKSEKLCLCAEQYSAVWRLSALTAVISAILVASNVGCNLDPRANAINHLSAAQLDIKKHEVNNAIIELRRAVQLDPQLAKAHSELGRLYAQEGNLRGAYQELQEALKMDPDDRDAHMAMAEVLVRSGSFANAENEANLILGKWKDLPAASLVLAEAEVGQREPEKARVIVEQFLRSNPNDNRALFDLAVIQLATGKWPDAEANLRRSWANEPNSLASALLLASQMEKHGDTNGAEEVLKQLVAKHPNNPTTHYLLANFYVSQKRLKDAEGEVKIVEGFGKSDPVYRGALGQFYVAAGRLDDAERAFKQVLASNPRDWENWRRLAALYAYSNRPKDARGAVDNILKANPGDWGALLIRAQLDLGEGMPDKAVLDLQTAQHSNPDSPLIYFQLARAYILQGKQEEARGALADALKRDPNMVPAKMIEAELDMHSGQAERAIDELAKVVDQKPNSLAPYLLLSNAQLATGHLDEAEQGLSKLMERITEQPSRAAVLRTLGWVKFQRKDYKHAITLASQSLDNEKHSMETLYLLGLSYAAEGETDKGLAAISSYLQQNADWELGYEALGILGLKLGKPDIAQQSFQRAVELAPESDSAALGLAEAYMAQKKLGLAHQTYVALTQRRPGLAAAHTELGQLDDMQGDWNGAMAEYEKAIQAYPENPVAKNNLAYLYVQHGHSLDVALKLAQEAKEAAPEDPKITDTLAWIYIQKGTYDAAVQFLKTCVEKEPKSPTYKYHLGVAYYKSGHMAEAKKELQLALQSSSFNDAADAKKLLASIQTN